jgi:hypothetical protein
MVSSVPSSGSCLEIDVELRVRDLVDHPHAADGGLGPERAVRDQVVDAILAVLALEVVLRPVRAVAREVQVDVGQPGAVGVEEALEAQAVVDRVDQRDAQGVGGDAATGRPAAEADLVPGLARGAWTSGSATIRKNAQTPRWR